MRFLACNVSSQNPFRGLPRSSLPFRGDSVCAIKRAADLATCPSPSKLDSTTLDGVFQDKDITQQTAASPPHTHTLLFSQPTPTRKMFDEEAAALVVDNGSGMCKAGFAGDDAPRAHHRPGAKRRA